MPTVAVVIAGYIGAGLGRARGQTREAQKGNGATDEKGSCELHIFLQKAAPTLKTRSEQGGAIKLRYNYVSSMRTCQPTQLLNDKIWTG
jgi:hypothetical protein